MGCDRGLLFENFISGRSLAKCRIFSHVKHFDWTFDFALSILFPLYKCKINFDHIFGVDLKNVYSLEVSFNNL